MGDVAFARGIVGEVGVVIDQRVGVDPTLLTPGAI
jgi:hypothetical protein